MEGLVEERQLLEEIGEDEKIFSFNLDFLWEHGFVESHMGALHSITQRGIDFVESPSPFNPPRDFVQQTIEISGGNVGQIVHSQYINASIFLDHLNSLIENHPEISPEHKKYWKDFLKEVPKKILDKIIEAAIQVAMQKMGP